MDPRSWCTYSILALKGACRVHKNPRGNEIYIILSWKVLAYLSVWPAISSKEALCRARFHRCWHYCRHHCHLRSLLLHCAMHQLLHVSTPCRGPSSPTPPRSTFLRGATGPSNREASRRWPFRVPVGVVASAGMATESTWWGWLVWKDGRSISRMRPWDKGDLPWTQSLRSKPLLAWPRPRCG